MLANKDKTKLAGFYNYHAEKEKEEPYEIEWDQEEYENTIDVLETHNKYLYEKLQEADERIDKAIEYIKELYEIAKEQDSENVNLIDRLEIILKTLRGEDNEDR